MSIVSFEEIDDADAAELRELIEEHHRRTASPVAARVLGDWEQMLPRFVKVMPDDYRRVLGPREQPAEVLSA